VKPTKTNTPSPFEGYNQLKTIKETNQKSDAILPSLNEDKLGSSDSFDAILMDYLISPYDQIFQYTIVENT